MKKIHDSKPTKSKIFIVEDHPVTRKGLCEIIEAESSLEVCGEASSWREALKKIHDQCPDAIVLDIHLDDGHGMALLEHLQKTKGPQTPVLVLSASNETIYAERFLKSGAMGYLMKTASVTKVLEAIRKVLTGHVAVSDAISTRLIQTRVRNRGNTHTPTGFNVLSNRELQVAELLQTGATIRAIAERLGVSQKTVGTYKARMMEKLNVRTMSELLALVQTTLTPPLQQNQPE